MPEAYFVTGATGFVGNELARQLLAARHRVVVLARQPARAGDLAALGAEIREGDVTDRHSVQQAMAGVDGVFHVAGWYRLGQRDNRQARAVNVEGTRNVLEVAGELHIPKVVYTSTLAVFGDTFGRVVDESYVHGGPWLSEYDRTKWAAHFEVAKPLARAGLPLVIVQPGAVYGRGDPSALGAVFRDYLKRRLFMVPQQAAYCWGTRSDTAAGHILAMERGRPGESYIIAGPAATLLRVLEIAETITGIPVPFLRPTPEIVRFGSRAIGKIERFVRLPAMISSEYLRVAAGVTYLGSSAKAQRDLGFNATPLAVGLQQMLSVDSGR